MTFAVLADIHGNSDALAAVLADMASLGVEEAVVLGDHFSGPLEAARCADMLIPRGFTCIRGNHDRYLVTQDPAEMSPSDQVAYAQLRPAHLDWLRGLPETAEISAEVLACHGTPQSDSRYWLETVDSDGSPRAATLEEIAAEAPAQAYSLILCGHTHIPRQVQLPDGPVILNPGSVGCPAYDDTHPVYHRMQTGTPQASYALVEKTNSGWLCNLRLVPYDSARMASLARDHGRLDWAQALATGWLPKTE
ncbi:metallophosphoesterase family protein [Thalassovita sp.]|uniref:metallophosphoesterase family protein n=1 Tax=Thalassovita sp. TaxID=1979401 RepID=UPI002AB05DA5|nr:metallophosphoesterase family protein [Thalassovita sp.]